MKYNNVNLDTYWNDDGSNEEGDLSLLEYPPLSQGNPSQATSLLLDFKEEQPLALEKVKDLALEAFQIAENDIFTYNPCFIVSIPSSSSEHLNVPCEYICKVLATHFPRLTHLRGALKRIETVPKSAIARPGERPDYDVHKRTIRYNGPTLNIPKSSVIMVDDIVTRRETSRACRDILKQATHCKSVLGFFIGRTRWR